MGPLAFHFLLPVHSLCCSLDYYHNLPASVSYKHSSLHASLPTRNVKAFLSIQRSEVGQMVLQLVLQLLHLAGLHSLGLLVGGAEGDGCTAVHYKMQTHTNFPQ